MYFILAMANLITYFAHVYRQATWKTYNASKQTIAATEIESKTDAKKTDKTEKGNK